MAYHLILRLILLLNSHLVPTMASVADRLIVNFRVSMLDSLHATRPAGAFNRKASFEGIIVSFRERTYTNYTSPVIVVDDELLYLWLTIVA